MQQKWKELLPYLEKYVNEKTLEEMSQELKLDKEELRLFLHRYRKFRIVDKNNLALRLITAKFIYPEYFTPTAQFFRATGIRRKRWWQLYKGEKKMTGKEFSAVYHHLKIDDKELVKGLQLELFENGI